jgi:DNA-binding transcriptional ArsR family regulator
MAKDEPLDAVWKALADPTRRAILDLLRDGPRTTSDIVAGFAHLSRFGVMKHLDVLKRCGLVVVRAEGRRRYNSLNAVPIRRIYERWVSRYEDFWADTLVRIKETAEDGGAD